METRRTPVVLAASLAAVAVALLIWSAQWAPDETALAQDAEPDAEAEIDALTAGETRQAPVLRTSNPGERPAEKQTSRPAGNRVLVRVTAHDKPVPSRGIRVVGTALRPVRALFLDDETGADGRCALTLPEGSFQIGLIPRRPEQPTHLPASPRSSTDDKMSMDSPQRLELDKPRGEATVHFEIPGCALRVRVLDADGQRPLEGVRVWAQHKAGLARFRGSGIPATTDAEGRAVIRELEAGTWRVNTSFGWMWPTADGAPRPITLERGQTGDMTLYLRAAGRVAFWLTDASGRRLQSPPAVVATLRGVDPERALEGGVVRLQGESRDQVRIARLRAERLARTTGRANPPPRMPPTPLSGPILFSGTYLLRIDDERLAVEGAPAVRLQPFAPVPEREFSILARETTELEMAVRLRHLVVITLRRPDGRGPRTGTRIRIWGRDPSTDERVQFLGSPPRVRRRFPPSRFEGYLDPGAYEVVIHPVKGGGEERVEHLVVPRGVVTDQVDALYRTYELPR